MKILITGASGYFATEMIRQIGKMKEIEVIALTSNPNKIPQVNESVCLISNEDFFEQASNAQEVDVIVHTAFCRKSDGRGLVESLNFLTKLAHWALRHNVKGFINLSSQSVFGSEKEELPQEDAVMAPGYLYSLAKSASELLLAEIAGEKMCYTNVRLASLMGPSGSVPHNVLYKFISSGLQGKTFNVVGGKQNFSFIDVRDAVEAVCRLMELPFSSWKNSYNLGPEQQTNMLEMADCICQKIEQLAGRKVNYVLQPDDTKLNAGMDSSMLYEEIHWRPKYSFDRIVEDTVNFMIENEDY